MFTSLSPDRETTSKSWLSGFILSIIEMDEHEYFYLENKTRTLVSRLISPLVSNNKELSERVRALEILLKEKVETMDELVTTSEENFAKVNNLEKLEDNFKQLSVDKNQAVASFEYKVDGLGLLIKAQAHDIECLLSKYELLSRNMSNMELDTEVRDIDYTNFKEGITSQIAEVTEYIKASLKTYEDKLSDSKNYISKVDKLQENFNLEMMPSVLTDIEQAKRNLEKLKADIENLQQQKATVTDLQELKSNRKTDLFSIERMGYNIKAIQNKQKAATEALPIIMKYSLSNVLGDALDLDALKTLSEKEEELFKDIEKVCAESIEDLKDKLDSIKESLKDKYQERSQAIPRGISQKWHESYLRQRESVRIPNKPDFSVGIKLKEDELTQKEKTNFKPKETANFKPKEKANFKPKEKGKLELDLKFKEEHKMEENITAKSSQGSPFQSEGPILLPNQNLLYNAGLSKNKWREKMRQKTENYIFRYPFDPEEFPLNQPRRSFDQVSDSSSNNSFEKSFRERNDENPSVKSKSAVSHERSDFTKSGEIKAEQPRTPESAEKEHEAFNNKTDTDKNVSAEEDQNIISNPDPNFEAEKAISNENSTERKSSDKNSDIVRNEQENPREQPVDVQQNEGNSGRKSKKSNPNIELIVADPSPAPNESSSKKKNEHSISDSENKLSLPSDRPPPFYQMPRYSLDYLKSDQFTQSMKKMKKSLSHLQSRMDTNEAQMVSLYESTNEDLQQQLFHFEQNVLANIRILEDEFKLYVKQNSHQKSDLRSGLSSLKQDVKSLEGSISSTSTNIGRLFQIVRFLNMLMNDSERGVTPVSSNMPAIHSDQSSKKKIRTKLDMLISSDEVLSSRTKSSGRFTNPKKLKLEAKNEKGSFLQMRRQ